MIITPSGEIEIFIDGNKIDYSASPVEITRNCNGLDGRFCVRTKFVPDGKEHIISCCIANYSPSEKDGIESGERLELKSFYTGKSKVSLGMVADTGYIKEMRTSIYDYNTGYLKNGVYYEILPKTRTHEFIFGIAWIKNCTDEKDVQTWFGADPTLF